MAAVLIDSNVLLDLMTEDSRWFAWSARALAGAAENFRLVINPIVYAEVSIRYSRIRTVLQLAAKAMLPSPVMLPEQEIAHPHSRQQQ